MGVTLFRNRDAGRAVKVISISDGYTFTGLDSQNRQVKVRLHGIDAPEKAQAFGNVARKALGDLIEGKTVEVQQVDKDRYGRVVANVHVGGTHVNRELVAKGGSNSDTNVQLLCRKCNLAKSDNI